MASILGTGASSGLPSPLNPEVLIQAVLFDLDGTLYRQAPLRALMAMELLTLPLTAPHLAGRRWRALSAYRHAQETLRSSSQGGLPAVTQIAMASTASGLSPAETEMLVSDWMHRRPLKYLRWCRTSGLVPLLDFLDRSGVRIGVLSDYPARAKLEALGLASRFSPVLCSSDPEIGRFKPNPRGFLRASALWNLRPSQVLVVGDRVEVDAAGASAAGMPCVIIGRPTTRRGTDSHLTLPSFERLCNVLDGRR